MSRSPTSPVAPEDKPGRPAWVRGAIDYAGALAFMAVYFIRHDILTATFALVVVSALALVAGLVVERRLAVSPLVWGLAALVFGVLTLVFHDPRIIKMKTTVIDAALGLVMLGGYALGKSPIKMLMGQSIALSEAHWRRLTLRFGVFFLLLAAANEVVWRTQPDAVWVLFRFPGLLIAAFAFSALQIPGMMKDSAAQEALVKLGETQE